jgi:hypothetical protein
MLGFRWFRRRYTGWVCYCFIVLTVGISVASAEESPKGETLAQIGARLSVESKPAFEASPYAVLSKDYFARFSRDPDAKPVDGEIVIDDRWTISTAHNALPLTKIMAGHLAQFFQGAMGFTLPVIELAEMGDVYHSIVLLDAGGGVANVRESFTIDVRRHQVMVRGSDDRGLRDGVVKLVDLIGFRQAPFLKKGEQVYTPRIGVRLGSIPYQPVD